MERITITLDDDLLAEVDALCRKRGYGSRSEALRDMIRSELARESTVAANAPDADRPCYGTLTYVYDHGIRDLPARLTDNHHSHHAISVATTHVHVNADNCLEVSILAGTATNLRAFADSVTSQRGVRYGHLHVVPVEPGPQHQGHHHHHGHRHDP
jgi:Predicted transcriptional regulators containing the CopG/Arc/MetJ DNA-binding domain and a metal-binding domain